MSKVWSDEEIRDYRDAIIRAAQQFDEWDENVHVGRCSAEIVTQLVAERQTLRDHLGYLLARFEPVRSEDHDAGTVAYASYLSVQEFRQLRAALPERN